MVIAKEFRSEVPRSSVIKEASTLAGLSAHPGLPVVLRVDVSAKPFLLISLFYGINESNTSLRNFLNIDEQFRAAKKIEFLAIIRQLSEVLEYLHAHQLLHNDIKSDNVMIYKDLEGLRPVLIDLGKACKVGDGKAKRLTDAEKKNTETLVLLLKLLKVQHHRRLLVTFCTWQNNFKYRHSPQLPQNSRP